MNGGGGGATCSGASVGGAASRRITAWKWIAPRAWYSATLTKATRTVRCSAGRGDAGRGRQRPAEVDGGATPELGGERVPQDQALGVEAVQAQRPAQRGIVGPMADPAADRAAMRAALVPVAGPAGAPLAAPLPAGVDRAEAGGGEGDEQAGMGRRCCRGRPCRRQAGPDELVGVGPVGRGTGRAARLAPVPAGGQQHRVRLVGGVVDLADLAGGLVDVHGAAGQADRMGAMAGGGDLLLPTTELRPGGPGDQVLGEQPQRRRHHRHLPRATGRRRDAPTGAGSAGLGRRPGSGRCGRPHSGPSSRPSPGAGGRSGTVASRSRPPRMRRKDVPTSRRHALRPRCAQRSNSSVSLASSAA